jgi:hypothetical protein
MILVAHAYDTETAGVIFNRSNAAIREQGPRGRETVVSHRGRRDRADPISAAGITYLVRRRRVPAGQQGHSASASVINTSGAPMASELGSSGVIRSINWPKTLDADLHARFRSRS